MMRSESDKDSMKDYEEEDLDNNSDPDYHYNAAPKQTLKTPHGSNLVRHSFPSFRDTEALLLDDQKQS